MTEPETTATPETPEGAIPSAAAIVEPLNRVEVVATGQGYILTGTPGTTATAILDGMLATPDGYPEIVLATIAEGAAQASFVAPPHCGRIRIESGTPGTASIMAANFRPALSGTSSGGGTTPAPSPGLIYIYSEGVPAALAGDTVYDVGECPAVLDLSALSFDWRQRVETCELWLSLPATGALPVITFPASWIWPDGLPSLNTPGKSYRIAIRREPSQVAANLAYSA